MTYGEVFRFRVCRANQRCAGIDKTIRLCHRGGFPVSVPVWYFQTPGLSLCPRSAGNRQRGPDSGEKDCFYGQAIPEPNPGASAMREIHGKELKRNSHRGSGGLSLQGSEAWLKRTAVRKRFIWNIVLTDCQPKKLSKLTRFWFPGRFGTLMLETNG